MATTTEISNHDSIHHVSPHGFDSTMTTSYPRRIPVGFRSYASACSIFRAPRFGWWVVTHSLEASYC